MVVGGSVLLAILGLDLLGLPMPRCIFATVLGIRCPGCGTQRAIVSLCSGHLVEAVRYNYSLLLTVPVLSLLALSVAFPTRVLSAAGTFLKSTPMLYTYGAFVLVWFILRNLFGV